MTNKYQRYDGPVRPPLRTITELAAEFGITRAQLAGRLGKSADAPKPELKNMGTVRNTWYNPSEMRKWWAKQPK